MSWVNVGVAAVNIGAGLFGSSQEKKAAAQRAQGYGRAGAVTNEAFDQAQGYIDPRLEQEGAAMDRVNSLLGLSGEAPDYSTFRDSPGYQFQLDQGQQAIERSAAARGGLNSGNTLASVTEYGQGLADKTFNNYLAQVMGLSQQGADRYSAEMATGRGDRLAEYELGKAGVRASGTEGSTNQLLNAAGGVAGAVGNMDFSSWGSKPNITPEYGSNAYWTRQAEQYGG